MGQHWLFITFCGFLLAVAVTFCLFWVYSRIMLLGAQYRYRYTKVPSFSSTFRLSSSPSRSAGRMIPTLLRSVSFEGNETSKTLYELGRHDD